MEKPTLTLADKTALLDRYARHHHAKSIATAMSILGSKMDAEDGVQSALVSAFQHLDQFDPSHLVQGEMRKVEAVFEAWMNRIVVNTCITLKRSTVKHRQRNVPISTELGGWGHEFDSADENPILTDPAPGPEDVALRREQEAEAKTLVLEALKSMQPAQRELIEQIFLEERNRVEVAGEKGVTYSALLQRLTRARKRLRIEIEC